MERFVPLELVEVGHLTAAFAGLLLVVLARGLSRGYHAAFRATLILLTLASVAVILKGFDWEEAIILACIASPRDRRRSCSSGRAAATGSNGRTWCWRLRR